MTDQHQQAPPTDKETSPRYEPPTLTIIGPLEKITLGSTGDKGDGGVVKRKD